MTTGRTRTKFFASDRRLLPLAGLGGALLVSGVAAAEPPSLEIPIDCEVGRTCFIQNYVDHDPGPGFRDYRCGDLGYDGDTGTDFRLRTYREMAAGVRVLAAAPGVVRAVRDGMPDINVRRIGVDALDGKHAGNSVAIRHADGWETQYNHMRKGSIEVGRGDTVKAGRVLGLVGLSGKTEFPHVEFSVRHRGKAIDPFVGTTDALGCDEEPKPLWSARALTTLEYLPTGTLGAGFAPVKPDRETIESGIYTDSVIHSASPALVFWVYVFGLHAGDDAWTRLLAPDGSVMAEKRQRYETGKAQAFSFVGKKLKAALWPDGAYRGEFVLTRDTDGRRRTVLRAERTVRIE